MVDDLNFLKIRFSDNKKVQKNQDIRRFYFIPIKIVVTNNILYILLIVFRLLMLVFKNIMNKDLTIF